MNKRYIPLILVFVAILLMPALTPFTMTYAIQTNKELSYRPWIAKLSPQLLDKSFYSESFFAKLSIPLETPGNPPWVHVLAHVRPGQTKVDIIASPLTDISFILKHTRGIIFAYKLPQYWYIEAWVTYNDVIALAKTPYVFKILAEESPIKQLLAEQNNNPYTSRLPGIGRAQPTLYAAAKTIGATKVWEQYNITGKGITVAVVDTGVDFGITDLGAGAIARTSEGIPMIFDADELGLTLTLSKAIDSNGTLDVELPVTFFSWPSIIGQTDYGWVLYISPSGHEYMVQFPLNHFKVGDIHSKNNIFKFGIAVQTVYPHYGMAGILQYTIPVILADTNDDGKYDTVYADLSTIYYYIMYVLHEAGLAPAPNPAWRDFSFADEKPAYYGNEVMARDFNGDGVNDFSAGELAGWVYDWLGILTGYSKEYGWDKDWEFSAVILPGLDPSGNYVDIAYDWLGHGTSCASVIASRGRVAYNLGYGVFHLKGIAPDAKIASTPGYLINAFTAEFFWSGFSAINNMPWNWKYTGEHKANIISNSWGLSYIGIVGFASGMDPMSLLVNYLVSETGTIIVFAMGNGGPGYGTAVIPGSASLVISVGASTLFAYRPLYGYLPGPGGEVVSWSDRGPTDMGAVKPDVVNIGSFAWAPAPWHFGLGNGLGAYDLFGGTSEATPMTAGSIALILQAYYEKYGKYPTPTYVKSLLKSTAKDLGYDPFTQGSGQVDVYTAVKTIMEGGIPIVYSYSAFYNELPYMDYKGLNLTIKPVGDTQIYTGPLYPGETKNITLTINGKGEYTLKPVRYTAVRMNLLKYLDLSDAVAFTPSGPIPLRKLIVGVKGDILYINLSYPAITHIMIPVSKDAWNNKDFVEFVASIPYSVYDPLGRKGQYVPWIIAGIDLHYWIDLNGDKKIELNETARINYDIRYANDWHVTFGDPNSKIASILNYLKEYLGKLPANAEQSVLLDIRVFSNAYYYVFGYGIVPFRLDLIQASRTQWNWITVPSGQVSSGNVTITVKVPSNAKPGIYQGYVIVYGGDKPVLVPISIVVKAAITPNTPGLILTSMNNETLYSNYYVAGPFDWSWRYESGDWRIFPVDVDDPSVVGLIVKVMWKDANTNIDLFVAGYYTPYILAGPPLSFFYGSVIAGKFSWFIHGSSGWGTHFDTPSDTQSAVFAPTPVLGTYWVVIRNTLIGASGQYPENIQVEIIPIRASINTKLGAVVIPVVNGTGKADIIVWGSYALSYAPIMTITEQGNAVVSTPSMTGFGDYQKIPVTVKASETSIAVMLIELPGYYQYIVGYTMLGYRSFLLLAPAYVPVVLYIVPTK